jgi:hypothetical protein
MEVVSEMKSYTDKPNLCPTCNTVITPREAKEYADTGQMRDRIAIKDALIADLQHELKVTNIHLNAARDELRDARIIGERLREVRR